MAGKKDDKGLLTDRQRSDLLGLALAALALFMGLSLIPAEVGGHGNTMGVVGEAFSVVGRALLGAGIFLIPVIPAVGALAAFGVRRELALRWSILTTALALLLPIAVGVAAAPEAAAAWAGWWGLLVGSPLTAAVGAVGAAMLVLFVATAASIATIGWNPARTAVGGATAGARAIRDAAGSVDSAAVAGPFRRMTGLFRRRPPARLAPTDTGFAPAPDVPPLGAGPDVPMVRSKRKKGRRDKRNGAAMPEFEGAIVAGEAGEAPGVALLDARPPRDPALTEQELDRLADVLIRTLETFKVQGRIVGRTTGPVVTQYEFAPAPGIKVSRVEALDADLALALKAPSVRIVAPIPGKAAVGVEVPNPEPEVVYLREIVDSVEFRRSRGQLPLALGKDLEGGPYVADLAKMPHLLIAGATGSGKSVCINTIITSLVYRHSPETLRLLMVDPKMVELSMYGDLPHLRHPVVTDPEDAALVLRWAVYEMERRYELLSQNNVRSIAEFNRRVGDGGVLRRAEPKGPEGDPDRWLYTDGPLPYVVVIVDELADLMMAVQSEIERPLAQLAQKARAIGIHLIVATQRPSVNVITGLIKANFPCRIG
ncbi:MAG: DNA translocase FtsK, partial [Gemmatimonadetes bacterium]|nr:DNA translocase FtsK [Gemmatimonadota bacterium]